MFFTLFKAAERGLDTDDVEIDLRGADVVIVLNAHHLEEATALPTRSADAGGDVVVAARVFAELKQNAPNVLQSAERVRVVNSDDIADAVKQPFASPLPTIQRQLKRTLDVVLSICLALVLSPLVVIAIAATKLFSKGPVLFRQTRVGCDGKRFTMLKLRTMTVNNDDSEHRAYVARIISGEAEAYDGTFKMVGDSRITRVGRVLRRYSIDEIPQLWNVICGDMSLVGPRPSLVHEVALYDDRAWQRLRVQPGLTGLWQVSGRCNLTFEEMVELDVKYWTAWNLLRDITILFKTPAVVLTARGAA